MMSTIWRSQLGRQRHIGISEGRESMEHITYERYIARPIFLYRFEVCLHTVYSIAYMYMNRAV